MHVAADSAAAARVRVRLAEFLDAHGPGDQAHSDALLVASELVANAVSHGSREGDEIDVEFKIAGGRLCMSVSDAGRGSGALVAFTPDAERERGRGLQVVDQLAEWSERVVGGRREVQAQLPLR